jgi:hypothetical protein
MGRKQQVRCHGDSRRFELVADLVYSYFGNSIKHIADVAGGQGLLSRYLNKKNYISEVVDPRGYTLVGVSSRQCEFNSQMANFYDLIIGLHPDDATKAVAESAFYRPTILIPCCNFWDKTRKLSAKALVQAICEYYEANNIEYEEIVLDFRGPKNVAIITKGRQKQ